MHKICMDIGASTGGFTDCMLQNGAKQVYAVDVGVGQLDQRLLSDPRVVDLVAAFQQLNQLVPVPTFQLGEETQIAKIDTKQRKLQRQDIVRRTAFEKRGRDGLPGEAPV